MIRKKQIKKIMPYAVLLAAVIQIIAASGISGGFFNSGQRLSDSLLFAQPAGFTFAIWGLIYLFATIYAVYQVIPKFNNYVLEYNRPYVFLLFIGSTAWLWTATFSGALLWATVLVLMLMAWVGMRATYIDPKISEIKPTLSPIHRFLSCGILFPYAAWVGIAQFVNIGAVSIDSFRFMGILNLGFNISLLAVIIVYTFIQYKKRGNPFWFGIVLVWALFGVVAANVGQGNDIVLLLSLTALLGSVVYFVIKSVLPLIKK